MKSVRLLGWMLLTLWCVIQLIASWGGHLDPRVVGVLPAVLVLALNGITLATVTLTAALLLCRCWRAAAMTLAVLIASLPTLYDRCPLTLSSHGSDDEPGFTLLSYNVQGFDFGEYRNDSTLSVNESMQLLLDSDADMVAVIEPYYLGRCYEQQPTIVPMTDRLFEKYPFRYHQERDNIDFFSKHPFKPVELLPPSPSTNQREGDIWPHYEMAFDVTMDSAHQVRIVVAHLDSYLLTPHERKLFTHDVERKYIKSENIERKFGSAFVKRARHARELHQTLDNTDGNLVVSCDLNDVAGSYAYRTLKGDNLTDAYIHCSTGPGYTYQNYHLNFRIDHVFYRGGIEAVSCQVLKGGRSDHRALLTRFVWR